MKIQWVVVPIVLALVAVATYFADSAATANRHHHAHHHGGVVRYSYAPRAYIPYPHVSGYGAGGGRHGSYVYPHHHHHHHGW